MFFYLKISCKDQRILKKFLYLFTKLESFPIVIKSFPKSEKRKFVTVLKSPHVNKTAQEQFEYRYYSRHLLVRSFKPLTLFLFLKKLKNLSFAGINFEVKSFFDKNKTHKHALQIISPDNIMLKKITDQQDINEKILKFNPQSFNSVVPLKDDKSYLLLSKKYMQLFDLYGEICLKKVFHL
jgi:ribosomal protein S10